MSLGGFPEILSNQWKETKNVEKNLKQLELLEAKLKEVIELMKKVVEKKSESLKETQELEREIEQTRREARETREEKRATELELSQIREFNFHQSQKTLRSDAIERAIYKDITQSYRIDNSMALEKLLYILAGQITKLLSLTGISKDISNITVQTLERYLSYLIESYLVFTLLNYAENEGRAQRRGRKVYFVDGAIRNSALHKTENEIFNDPVELGPLQENLVAAHLRALGEQSNVRLYHWRWKNHEVDFIYDDHSCPLALEIGSSFKHKRVSLKEFLKKHPKFHGGCYYVAPGINFSSAEAGEAGIGQMPLDLLLLAAGIQQKEALKARLSAFEKKVI